MYRPLISGFLFVWAVLGAARAQEVLWPSFPNHAAVLPPAPVALRDVDKAAR